MDAITEITKPEDDQFANWRKRLKGDMSPPVRDGKPDSGFYRNRNVPVAFWRGTAGNLKCHIGGRPCTDELRAFDTWPFVAEHPVTKAVYDDFLRTGTWPDQNHTVTLSNQIPLDDNTIEGLEAQIDMLANEADMLMKKGAAKTQIEADHAADVATRLGELWTKTDNLRKVEKQPHLDAERLVDDKYRPALATASIYSRIKAVIIKPFLDAENARIEKARLEAAAADRKRLQNIEDKRKADAAAHAKAVADAAAANAPPPPPPAPPQEEEPPPPMPEFAPASAGTRGRSVHARTKKVALIEDYPAALASFAQHEQVKALVQDLANKQAKIGMATPGCKIVNEGSAV